MGKSGALVMVPPHEAAFLGSALYLGAMRNVEEGETTFNMLRLMPGAAAYMFVLML